MACRGLALPGNPLVPGVARCEGSLQAGGPRCRLGCAAAPVHHGYLHLLLREVGRYSERWGAVPAVLVRGAGAMDVFLRDACASGQQSHQQFEPDPQNLLSACAAAGCCSLWRVARPARGVRVPDWVDVLLPRDAALYAAADSNFLRTNGAVAPGRRHGAGAPAL